MSKVKGKGIIHSVLSGDTVVVMGYVPSGPPPMKQLNLSHISAPRLGNKGKVDEPYAWASREFLRRNCIGKCVYFRKDYEFRGREFATIWLQNSAADPPETGENLGLKVVSEGWAKVRRIPAVPQQGMPNERTPDYEPLVKLEEAAEAAQKGIFNKEPGAAEKSVRNVIYEGYDAIAMVDDFKGGRVHAIVEYVPNGSTVRALILPTFQHISLYLAGISCPRPPQTAPGADGAAPEGPEAEPKDAAAAVRAKADNAIAAEAKHFTECRVLHRDVGIQILGADKYNNFFGFVFFDDNKGSNLSEELLSNGFAKVVEWSAKSLGPAAEPLRAAEKVAKDKKIRIWKDFVAVERTPVVKNPPSIDKVPTNEREFPAKVVEIVSGDTIVVVDLTTNPPVEKRITLSSIRAPKVAPQNRGKGAEQKKDEEYAWESKEFLRNLLIGKKVQVCIEFLRSIPSDDPTREGAPRPDLTCASVLVDTKNVAEALVEAGLAKVVRHRADDERSSFYDALLAAEGRASKATKGVWSKGAPPPLHHLNDLTLPPGDPNSREAKAIKERAKVMFPFLQRKGQLRAVVAYVINGSRFKLYVAAESCLITFALAGVRCPKVGARDAGKGEPFADEARLFSRQQCNQHEVEVEIESQDKGGTFIGVMILAKTKQNVAVLLAEAGLAKVDPGARLESKTYGRELLAAQEQAKAQSKKLWSLPREEVEALDRPDEGVQEEELAVQCTEVLEGSRLFCQLRDDSGVAWLTQQIAAMALLPPSGPFPLGKLRDGELCLAQFTADDQWYRARVEKVIRDTTGAPGGSLVSFIDYGNRDEVSLDRIRPVEQSLLALPPQAFECVLAGLKVPSLSDEFGVEAAEYLKSLVWDRPLVARVLYRDSRKRCHVVLSDGSDVTINSQMVRAGFARAKKTPEVPIPDDLVPSMKIDEEIAKKSRANLWQYGEADFSDEEQEIAMRSGRGGRGGRGGGRGGATRGGAKK